MVRITNMRTFIGIIKDKLSLSKLFFSNPKTSQLHISVLHVTTHSPTSPPTDHHLATLLSLGNNSRATASILIHSLITRLNRTTNSHVALKCLITMHHVITRGPFILKDQIIFLVSSNGRNNLKLSNFRDGTTHVTWMMSSWVRWYACYIERILFMSKNMDYVMYTSSCSVLEREKQEDLILSLSNSDLITAVGSLVGVMEEICKVPDDLLVEGNIINHRLVRCVMELVKKDYLSTVNEILVRVSEFKERVSLLSCNDSVELGYVLERLISCKEKLLELFSMKKTSVERLWEVIEELSNEIGLQKPLKESGGVGVSRLSWGQS